MAKLESFGLCEKDPNSWDANYVKREKKRIRSGVPQGSVMGQLLFLLFVNDLPRVINVTTLLFADEGKVVLSSSQAFCRAPSTMPAIGR